MWPAQTSLHQGLRVSGAGVEGLAVTETTQKVIMEFCVIYARSSIPAMAPRIGIPRRGSPRRQPCRARNHHNRIQAPAHSARDRRGRETPRLNREPRPRPDRPVRRGTDVDDVAALLTVTEICSLAASTTAWRRPVCYKTWLPTILQPRQRRRSGRPSTSLRWSAQAGISGRSGRAGGCGSFSNTATWLWLAEVNGARSQPAQRSRTRKPVILAIRSSSDGHTYR